MPDHAAQRCRLVEHLRNVERTEGLDKAKSTVTDWLDVLDELSEAGQNTLELQNMIRLAAKQLDLLPVDEGRVKWLVPVEAKR